MKEIDRLIQEKIRCEQSMWAARKTTAALATLGRLGIAANVEARIAAAMDARILRGVARELVEEIPNMSPAEAGRAAMVAVDAAVLAGHAELAAYIAREAEVKTYEAKP